MIVPSPMEITPSLMAGVTLEDGSTIEVSTSSYRVTLPDGEVLVEGDDIRPSPLTRHYGEIAATVIAFLAHDAELVEFSTLGRWGQQYPESATPVEHIRDDLVFDDLRVGQWAHEHDVELSTLAERLEGKNDATGG
jgi:hypothetical protein